MSTVISSNVVKYRTLLYLAKTSGRCVSCLKDVPKRDTGRSRVTCEDPKCAKEYQHLYYLHITKAKRESVRQVSQEERAARRRAGYDHRAVRGRAFAALKSFKRTVEHNEAVFARAFGQEQ